MHKFQKSKAAKLELLKYFAHWRPKETYSVLKQKALNSFSSVEFKRSALTKTMSTYVKQYITSSSDFRTMSSLGSILRKTPIVLLSTISSTYGTSISGVCTFVNQSWNRHHQRQIDTGQSCEMSNLLHRWNLSNQTLPQEKRVNRDKFKT